LFFVGSIVSYRKAEKVDCELCKKYTEFWHKRRIQLRGMM